MSPARPSIPVLKAEVSRMLSLAREHRRQANQMAADSHPNVARLLREAAKRIDAAADDLRAAHLKLGDAEVQQRFADSRLVESTKPPGVHERRWRRRREGA